MSLIAGAAMWQKTVALLEQIVSYYYKVTMLHTVLLIHRTLQNADFAVIMRQVIS
jgi:hypothetical protein